MALTLYHNDMSVCSIKSRIALAEKGLEWTSVHLDLRAGDTQKPEYLKLNPHALVPTLVHDDKVVIESNVIGEYLDDAFPSPSLRPAEPIARARMRLWSKQLDEGIHAATGTVTTCIAFRHQWLARPREDFERWIANTPQADRRERSRANVEQGTDSPFFTPAVLRFIRMLDEMEQALAAHAWLAGDSYSLADAGFTPYIMRLEVIGFEREIRARPRVLAWRERLRARPSHAGAITKWINPKYLALFAEHRDAASAKIATILESKA